MAHRHTSKAAAGGASVTIAPYEYSLVWEFVGKGRYLQAAFCRSAAQLYSTKFGKLTVKNLSNIAAEGAFLGLLEWSKEIGCRLEESVFVSGASGGSVEILTWLLDNDCPLTKDAAICTAAARGGHLDALKFLSLHGCQPVYDTFTAAAENGHLNVLQFAHEFRCKVYTESVVEAATKHGHIHILQWIYETKSLNVCIEDSFNGTLPELAAREGQIEVLRWSRDISGWDEQTCLYAIKGGQLETLKWLLKEGCPWTVDYKCYEFGDAGIHLAAYWGFIPLVEYLINCGADLNLLEDEGCTALYLATEQNHVECVRMLLAAGADVHIPNGAYQTPFGIAFEKRYLEVAVLIWAAGGTITTTYVEEEDSD